MERYPKEIGLARQHQFLKLIGNPQKHLKVIHIAGTSGKGSTATYIHSLLRGMGQSVGLHISPHLTDIRERAQINGRLLDEHAFCRYLTELIPAIRSLICSEYGRPTYFQILVTLALHAFKNEHMTYAVMETGVGGMLDATNAVTEPNKVAVLTRIGKDHTAVLGKTIAKIAYQKAMIMHPGNHGFFVSQGRRVDSVFESVAREQHAYIVKMPRTSIRIRSSSLSRIVYDISYSGIDISGIAIPTAARYQVENSALAIAVARYIAGRDNLSWHVDSIKSILAHTRVDGRMQIIGVGGKTIILDAAHNPQKMRWLITTLRHTWPHHQFCFVLAFKKGKDYEHMLELIAPYASSVLVSSFSKRTMGADVAHDPRIVAKELQLVRNMHISLVPDSGSALQEALGSKHNIIVITGSIYFLSEIYRHLRELPVDNTSFI